MAYVLNRDGEILRLEFSGTVTVQDLVQGAADLAEFEDASAIAPNRIADLRGVERLALDFAGILSFTEVRRQKRFRNQFKTAIIAASPVHYGFARMFQTLNDHPQIAIAIFADDAEALNWVRSSQATP